MLKIGIYAPTYNCGKYVGEMINSIKSQTYENWKLAILDDGSKDDSYKIALDASNNDDRIVVKKHKSHDGRIGYIKNKCVEMLESPDVLASVDADDLVPKDALQNVIDTFQDKSIGAVCGNFNCFNADGKVWTYGHITRDQAFVKEKLLSFMNFSPLRAYRYEYFKQVGGYDKNLTSAVDYDLALKLDEICVIKKINKITYHYRQHNSQTSHKFREDQNSNAKMALLNALNRREMYDYTVEGDKPPFRLVEKR